MRKKVFLHLAAYSTLTGCDSSSLEKSSRKQSFSHSIQHSDGKRDSVFPTRSIPNNVIPEPTVLKAGERRRPNSSFSPGI